jgi:hypothetical protein
MRARADARSTPVLLAITIVSLFASLAAADAARAIERIERTTGFNGPVYAISEPDASGTRYLGGAFTDYAPWDTGHAALTDPTTGAIDPSLVNVDGGSVFDVESDGAGGIFVAGDFTQVDGQPRYGLARVLGDGSLDPAWTSGLTNAGGWINDIELSGGVLYAVGQFATVGTPAAASTQRSNAAAFDAATGSLTAWDPATRANTVVTTVSIDTARAYAYLGGNFTCVNARPAGDCSTAAGGNTVTALARVDLVNGDKTLFPGIGGGTTVNDSALSADGLWLYIGGQFSSLGGQARTNAGAIRADTDSLTVGAWAPDLPAGGQVQALEPVASSMYIGGGFDGTVGGQRISLLARFTSDPTAAATLTLAPAVTGDFVRAIQAVGADIAIGGVFGAVGGEFRRNAARLTSLGAVTAWNPHPNGGVNAIGELGSGVLIGGSFAQAGGSERLHAAAVNRFGDLTDWTADVSATVRAVAVGSGAVYLGGSFLEAEGGVTRNRAAAFTFDGTLSTWDPNVDNPVNAIAVGGDTIYLGGQFSIVGGSTPRNYAAAYTTGGALASWDPNFDGYVNALAFSDGIIYAGGEFSQVGGSTPRDYAAAVTTSGTPVPGWDPDLDDPVSAVAVSGTTIYLGGEFTSADGGTPRDYAAAFGSTGTLLPWNPGAGNFVNALAVAGGTVYVGGNFTSIGVQPINRAAAVDAVSGALDAAWNPSANGAVHAIGATASTVYLGGSFTQLGSATRTYSAAVTTSGTVLDPWPGPVTPIYTLTLAKAGTGSGSVTSSPTGIDCGATCSAQYRSGTSVTLTAAPDSTSSFVGWSGACSGTATTCTITVDQARSVTATFTTNGSATATPSASTPKTKAKPTIRVVTARATGNAIVVRLRTSTPGRIRVVGTVRSSHLRAARTAVCSRSRTAARAGVITLVCPLNAVGRSLLAERSLVVRLAVTLTPRRGRASTAVRSVWLPMLAPDVTPVTG